MMRLQAMKSPDAPDQISFFAFHSFLVEVYMNAGGLCAVDTNSKLEIS